MANRSRPTVFSVAFTIVAVVILVASLLFAFIPEAELSRFLTTRIVLAQLFAFPRTVGFVFTVVFALIIIVALNVKGWAGLRHNLSLVACSLMVVSGLVLIGAGQADPVFEETDSGQQVVTVATYNSNDKLDAAALKELLVENRVSVLALPEFGADDDGAAVRLSRLMEEAGVDPDDYQIFTSESYGSVAPVTVVVAKSFGTYTHVDSSLGSTTFGTVVLEPADSTSPTIVAVHAAPPLPSLMTDWRNDLETIAEYAADPDTLVLGDFNATMRHGALATVAAVDVLSANSVLSGGARGTWPANTVLDQRAAIDHILVPDDGYTVVETETYDYGVSDHLALVSKLVPDADD